MSNKHNDSSIIEKETTTSSTHSPRKHEKTFNLLLGIFAIFGVAILGYQVWSDINTESSILVGPIVTKEEAITRSEDFLRENNFNIDGYTSSISVSSDDNADSFLQRNLSKEEALTYVKDNKISTSFYDVRFFKDSEINEFLLSIDIKSGEIVYFSNTIPENEERASLDKEAARTVVDTFFADTKYQLTDFEERDYSTDKVQDRVDHTFSFKLANSAISSQYGEAYPLIQVAVLGDKIGSFSYYLFVPEEFDREITQQLSVGSLLTLLSGLASVFMLILALVYLVKAFNNKKASWKVYAFLSGITFIILSLGAINDYPLLKSLYTTDMPFGVSMGILLIMTIIGVIFISAVIFISGVAGDYVTKSIWPNSFKASFERFPVSVLRGYVVAFATLAVTQVIYLIGEQYFGVWSLPMTLESYSFLLSISPFLSVFSIVFLAAFSEEILYRLFGVSIFKKYFKSTFLAIAVSALIWAIAHSNYPVFPVYFRGIELLIGGIIWGYFFLRYDITTLISAHYVYNAVLFSISMIVLGIPSLTFSAIILFILPILLIPIHKFITSRIDR